MFWTSESEDFNRPIWLFNPSSVRSQFPGGERRKKGSQILKNTLNTMPFIAMIRSQKNVLSKNQRKMGQYHWLNTIREMHRVRPNRKPAFGERVRIVFWSFVLISSQIPCVAIRVLLAIFLLYKVFFLIKFLIKFFLIKFIGALFTLIHSDMGTFLPLFVRLRAD